MRNAKQNIEQGYGNVETLINEEDVFKITTTERYVVLEFYHENFNKCIKMDEKLKILSQKHLFTKFLKINVKDAPFLINKLKIKILPIVIIYNFGIESNRLIGFDKLKFDNSGDFEIESLEKFLLDNGE